MKIKDVFSSSSGVYAIFKELFPEKYTLFYGDIETADLDNYFYYKYGNRTVVQFIEDNASNVQVAVKLIINMHLKQWTKMYDALFSEYDFLQPYKNVTEKSGTDTHTIKTDNEDTTQTKGFNSSDYIDNDKNITDGTKKDTTEYGSKTTITGNIGNKSYAELVNSELELSKVKFSTLIEDDLLKEMCLSIYESEEN